MPSVLSKAASSFLLVLTIHTLLACAAAPPQKTPTALPDPLIVTIDPALAPIRAAILNCASALDVDQTIITYHPLAGQKSSLVITYATATSTSQAQSFLIGWDQLTFATADPELAESLRLRGIRSLYRSPTETSPNDAEFDAWIFPKDHLFRSRIQELLNLDRISPSARIAPGVTEMVEGLSDGENGLGILPKAWIGSNLFSVQLDDDSLRALQLPILAELLVDSDLPQRLIACLQSPAAQEILSENYLPLTLSQ